MVCYDRSYIFPNVIALHHVARMACLFHGDAMLGSTEISAVPCDCTPGTFRLTGRGRSHLTCPSSNLPSSRVFS